MTTQPAKRIYPEEYFAFGDTETTGLGRDARLLEIAVIMTDKHLNRIGDNQFTALVRYSADEVAAIKATCHPKVLEMHEKTGLWERVQGEDALPLEEIDALLVEFIKQYAPESRQAQFAGNSIRLDLNMIEWYLPRVSEQLHFRSMDITSLATGSRIWTDVRAPRGELYDHTALGDTFSAIAQAQYLRAAMRK